VTRARILLADDHKDMRERVVHLLEGEFEILGALENGQAIVDAAAQLKPDVCLLDISLPVMSGIEAAYQLRANGSTAKIIFLTIHEDADFLQAALKTGASGYVIKRCLASDLQKAVEQALAGGTFISSSLLSGDGGKPKRPAY
jgi:DNA-binding NarL/FixJ family response regulator